MSHQFNSLSLIYFCFVFFWGEGGYQDKKIKITSKKFDDDVMSENYDFIVIFPIFDLFRAMRKPDSERIVCKTYVFINSNPLSYKNWKQN